MHIIIGIDDTDNAESRGTGYNARQLARIIEKKNLGITEGITRHQLFVHPSIPYTSQNSSAAIVVIANDFDLIKDEARGHLLKIAPKGCDIGLCLARIEKINSHIVSWGQRAKKEVLSKREAIPIAQNAKVYLEGLTGTHDGIIGALAAAGLRASENDGRFIWLKKQKELRDLTPGIITIHELISITGIDVVETLDGLSVQTKEKILIGDWVRPVLKNNQVILLAEKALKTEDYEWKCASKELVRAVS